MRQRSQKEAGNDFILRKFSDLLIFTLSLIYKSKALFYEIAFVTVSVKSLSSESSSSLSMI